MIKQLVIGVVCAFLPVMGYGAETSSAENLARRVGLHGQYNAVDVITHFGDMYLDSTNHDVTKHNNHLVHYLCFGRLMDEEKDEDTFIPPVPSGQNAYTNPLVRQDPNQTQLSEKETILRTLLAAAFRSNNGYSGSDLLSYVDTYIEKMENEILGGNPPIYLKDHIKGVKAYITAAEKIVSNPMADIREFQNKYKIDAQKIYNDVQSRFPVLGMSPPPSDEDDLFAPHAPRGSVAPPEELTEQEIINLLRTMNPDSYQETYLSMKEFISPKGGGILLNNKSDDDALNSIIKIFPALESIDLSETKVTDTGLSFLRNLTKLEVVNFTGCTEITAAAIKKTLLTHPILVVINLTHCANIIDADVKKLIRAYPKKNIFRQIDDETVINLKTVAIEDIDAAIKNGDLNGRSIDMTNAVREIKLLQNMEKDEVLRSLCEAMPDANTIRIHEQPDITDDGFYVIGEMKKIKDVFIYGCPKITDNVLESIKELNTVQTLSLGDTSITDNGLKTIATMKSIEALYFEDCLTITDKGLDYLKGLPNLVDLNLSGCNGITAAGIQKLYDDHPNKKTLEITMPDGTEFVDGVVR
ncbi:MAG: hypothetical protein K2X98_00890 [Alphaproteobacteria bacterium]|nr:hypothetical protein [Alphaproteobacteria bacterium]